MMSIQSPLMASHEHEDVDNAHGLFALPIDHSRNTTDSIDESVLPYPGFKPPSSQLEYMDQAPYPDFKPKTPHFAYINPERAEVDKSSHEEEYRSSAPPSSESPVPTDSVPPVKDATFFPPPPTPGSQDSSNIRSTPIHKATIACSSIDVLRHLQQAVAYYDDHLNRYGLSRFHFPTDWCLQVPGPPIYNTDVADHARVQTLRQVIPETSKETHPTESRPKTPYAPIPKLGTPSPLKASQASSLESPTSFGVHKEVADEPSDEIDDEFIKGVMSLNGQAVEQANTATSSDTSLTQSGSTTEASVEDGPARPSGCGADDLDGDGLLATAASRLADVEDKSFAATFSTEEPSALEVAAPGEVSDEQALGIGQSEVHDITEISDESHVLKAAKDADETAECIEQEQVETTGAQAHVANVIDDNKEAKEAATVIVKLPTVSSLYSSSKDVLAAAPSPAEVLSTVASTVPALSEEQWKEPIVKLPAAVPATQELNNALPLADMDEKLDSTPKKRPQLTIDSNLSEACVAKARDTDNCSDDSTSPESSASITSLPPSPSTPRTPTSPGAPTSLDIDEKALSIPSTTSALVFKPKSSQPVACSVIKYSFPPRIAAKAIEQKGFEYTPQQDIVATKQGTKPMPKDSLGRPATKEMSATQFKKHMAIQQKKKARDQVKDRVKQKKEFAKQEADILTKQIQEGKRVKEAAHAKSRKRNRKARVADAVMERQRAVPDAEFV